MVKKSSCSLLTVTTKIHQLAKRKCRGIKSDEREKEKRKERKKERKKGLPEKKIA